MDAKTADAFKGIGEVASGVNSVVSAGAGIYNALNPKQGPISRISLGGSGLGSLQPGGGSGSVSNLANNLRVQEVPQSPSLSLGGGGSAGQSMPQIDRSHEALLLKTLQAFQG